VIRYKSIFRVYPVDVAIVKDTATGFTIVKEKVKYPTCCPAIIVSKEAITKGESAIIGIEKVGAGPTSFFKTRNESKYKRIRRIRSSQICYKIKCTTTISSWYVN
jgi:hypothetical protein